MFDQKKKRMRIEEACRNLGIDEDDARIYVILHTMASGQKATEELVAVPFGDLLAMNRVAEASANAVFNNGYPPQYGEGILRMGTDNLYRQRHIETYNEQVLPAAEKIKIGLADIVLALFKR